MKISLLVLISFISTFKTLSAGANVALVIRPDLYAYSLVEIDADLAQKSFICAARMSLQHLSFRFAYQESGAYMVKITYVDLEDDIALSTQAVFPSIMGIEARFELEYPKKEFNMGVRTSVIATSDLSFMEDEEQIEIPLKWVSEFPENIADMKERALICRMDR